MQQPWADPVFSQLVFVLLSVLFCTVRRGLTLMIVVSLFVLDTALLLVIMLGVVTRLLRPLGATVSDVS